MSFSAICQYQDFPFRDQAQADHHKRHDCKGQVGGGARRRACGFNIPVEPNAKPPRVFAKGQRPQHRDHRAIPQTGGQHDQGQQQLRQPPQRKQSHNGRGRAARVGVERDGRNALRPAVARRHVMPTAPDSQRCERIERVKRDAIAGKPVVERGGQEY